MSGWSIVHAVDLVVCAAQASTLGAKIVLHGYALYVGGVAAVAMCTPRRSPSPVQGPRATARTQPDDEPLRFAAVIIAHDEERVIERPVLTLMGQAYRRDRYDVIVVADNCADDTAERARLAGARVLERSTGAAQGKSAALRFALDWVAAQNRYDAIAVFDADNEVDPRFLACVEERLRGGERVVQGVIDAKNPDTSWVSASSALGFWAIAAVAQAPRERARLSAALMGTGWAARMELHRSSGLAPASLTDDMEIGALLALRGVRVAYEPGARVFDEKPTELRSALGQRRRWMQGRWSIARTFVPQLLKRAIAPGSDPPFDAASRLRALDVALQLVAPSLLFTAVALMAIGGLELLLGTAGVGIEGGATGVIHGGTATILLGTAYYLAPALALRRFHPSTFTWACYLVQPFYLLFSAPLALVGLVLTRRKQWTHTAHTAEPARSKSDARAA